MLYEYIDHKPKVIVLERPIVEIVKSFVHLRIKNNYIGDNESDLLEDMSEPIMRSLHGLAWAKENNNGEFIFISYKDIVETPEKVINSIYEFCEINYFKHNFNNIVNKHPEDDSVYNMLGQHDVRSSISYNDENVKLSKNILKYCQQLDKKYGL